MTFDLKVFEKSTLKETTIKNYIRRAKTLNKKMEKNNIKLKQFRRIMKLIKDDYKENIGTMNNYLSAWKKYLELTGKTHLRIFKEISGMIVSNIKSRDDLKKGKEKKKIKLDIDEFNKKKDNFMTEMSNKINNKSYINEEELFLSFFILLPTRRDIYSSIRFIDDLNEVNEKYNYVYVKDDDYKVIINDCKDKVKCELEINNNVMKNIIDYLKPRWKNNKKIFDYVKSTLIAKRREASKKYFGISLTTIDLRDIYTSRNKVLETINQVKKDAKDMGHSLKTHIDYYMLK